ncbi:MAG: class I SAM-dependent methyltransferase [Saprospirales bacterium]|nr:class I SAM-dependent methyltransferase [Saprospirales bacterium]MBK8922820.1 class I SAM-dependent methyltransferase [Saprospirales bacterium]
MKRYYKWHAVLYDATRWTFLFGRQAMLRRLPALGSETVVAEVGCGTGRNLLHLARMHPEWRLVGIDVSPDMLRKASKATSRYSGRVQLFEQPYGADQFRLPEPADIILFSYSLTMFNPGWEAAIEQARADLKPGGFLAVVDFHDTRSAGLNWWMQRHNVRIDAHLLPVLAKQTTAVFQEIRKGWGGLWRYFMFIGEKR